MAFLSNYLRRLTFNQGYQGVQGTSNSTQGLQGISGVQGTVGIAGTTLLTNTQSGTYTLQRSDIGEVVSGASVIGIASNTFNAGESVIVLNNNLNRTTIDVTGIAATVSLFQEGVGTALTVNKKIKPKSFLNILCTRANQFILGGTLFDADIQATGGTIIDSDGFRIHVFTSPGPFNVTYTQPTYNTVEYVVVAGGGGSQAATAPTYSGGGGAGGFRTGTNFPVTVQDYTITVGAGGTVGATNGGNSVFSTITSTGGGRGNSGAGSPGGSGGGGGTVAPNAAGNGNTPPVSPPQGNNGSPGRTSPFIAGTGGGAGGAGPLGNNGGIGTSVSWVPTSYGTPGPSPGRWFAGGGGGINGPVTGIGGSGGGGPYGSPGTTNTGGGGGGNNTTGGSGIVIIRYPIT